MLNAADAIGHLEENVRFLVEKLEEVEQRYELLQKENVQLKQELEKIKSGTVGQESDSSGEQNRSITQGSNDEVKAEKLRHEIDLYIAEIDECVALLKEL